MTIKLHFLAVLSLLFITSGINAQNCGIYFNGSSSAYIQPSNTTISNFTISFWFRAVGAGPMFSSANDSVGLSGVGDKRVYFDATGTLYAGVYNGGTHIINSGMMLLDSSCHHVALTQDAAGIRLYIDGVFKGSQPYASTDQTSSPPFYWTLGHQYMIGDWEPQPPSYFFTGDIDELTIWNMPFSAAGITDTLMQLAYTGTEPNLQWYYTFNNCSYVSTTSQGQFADVMYYRNGVLPINSTCPIAANQITTGPVAGSPFCAGSSASVPYTSTASFTPSNVFTVQLSDSNGNFGSPVNIGDTTTTATSGSIHITIPPGTLPGSNYRVKVISSAPSITGTTNSNAIIISTVVIPSVSIVTPSQNVCPGTSATFTATPVNGGTPTYYWIKNRTFIPTDSSNYTDGSVQNNDTISCVMISSLSCASPDSATSNTLTITVNPLSAGIISAVKDTLCAGDVVQLMVTGATDSTLQWQSSPLLGTFSNITGADTTVYQSHDTQSSDYRVVVTSGNCTDTSSLFNVTVNPLPNPPALSTADSLICSSDSTAITASQGFSSYSWNDGDTTYYTYAKNAGGYWVTVTDANNCSVASGHINISVYPVPSVSIDVEGDTLSSFGATAYQWLFNDTLIHGATSSLYVAKQTGNYSVQITDSNGCTTISNSVYIMITGVMDLPDNVWRVYPNPASNEVYVSFTGDDAPTIIRLINITGQEVKMQMVPSGKENIVTISVSDLPAGIYELMVAGEKNSVTYKIIKE